ncbi:hypothetical protein ACFLV7_14645 [Chloroflexota bacterium]
MEIDNTPQNKFKYVLLILYLIAVTVSFSLLFYGRAYDDPFITYRYAQNLAKGLGFVYNPGLRVQSTITPFFTLILTAFYFIWRDIPHLAIILGAFSLAWGAVFLWILSKSWQTPIVGWVGLLLYPTFPLLFSTLGSETPVYLAFCLGAYAFYSQKRYDLSAIFAALAVLTRPDGALVPIILAADYLIRIRKPIPWKSITIFLLLTLPWFLFAWVYFGSPISATLAAKQQQGGMAISQKFAPGLLTIFRPFASNWFFWFEALLALVGFIFMAMRARIWLLFIAWIGLYIIAFSLLGVSRYYWYYAPIIPGFVVLAGLGITALANLVDRIQSRYDTKLVGVSHFSLLMSIVLITALFLGRGIGIERLRHLADTRLPIYRATGEWLKANTPNDAKIGTLEVGVIGYYAERTIVGFAGLILPEVGKQLTFESTYEDAALWALSRYHPEYLVLHAGHFPRLEQGYVNDHCQAVQRFEGEPYSYHEDLIIFYCSQE